MLSLFGSGTVWDSFIRREQVLVLCSSPPPTSCIAHNMDAPPADLPREYTKGLQEIYY